jgi:hypothetical protein
MRIAIHGETGLREVPADAEFYNNAELGYITTANRIVPLASAAEVERLW